MTVYLIKPLEKKSVVYHVEMFRENADGTVSWFNIDDTYRWGQGFIESDMDINLPYSDAKVAYTRNDVGWGAELDDSCACEFEFSDDITEEEQEAIKEAYYEGGAAWLFDGDHEWQEEDTCIEVYAPFQVSLCEDDGTVIEENVQLKDRPNPSTSWPFSTEFPKEEE